jgi:hypothetical protein
MLTATVVTLGATEISKILKSGTAVSLLLPGDKNTNSPIIADLGAMGRIVVFPAP